jgi:hypothetical protein
MPRLRSIAVLTIGVTLSLCACSPSFPARSPSELWTDLGLAPPPLDSGPGRTMGQSDQGPDPWEDATVSAPDMRLERPRDAAVPPSCSTFWPDACEIPCADRYAPEDILHIEPQEILELREGSYQYVCVVIEGTLKIHGSTQIEADVFSLQTSGRIDGVGTGPTGLGQGKDGRSSADNGSGGSGGSGICRGGIGAMLIVGAPPQLSGNSHLDFAEPGGQGGRGGQGSTELLRAAPGGVGGSGGASLQTRAARCQLAGQINLSGLPGKSGLSTSAGGGGGGAAGNLLFECTETHFMTGLLRIRLVGGAGGQGGAINERYYGSGGGGGAGGGMKVVTGRAFLNGSPLRTPHLLPSELADQISLSGGPRAPRSMHSSPAEVGTDGRPCRFEIRGN